MTGPHSHHSPSRVLGASVLLALAAFAVGLVVGEDSAGNRTGEAGDPTTLPTIVDDPDPTSTVSSTIADPAGDIERYRPAVHFTPDEYWMNDPNGPLYADGQYHLFYQYNPYGNLWGNIGWGHAVSDDLVEWEELSMALPAEPPNMAFSGSAVVDHLNTSGLCEDAGCIIAAYTGLVVDPATAITRQDQRIAVSNDDGNTFQPFDGNPVIDLDLVDFRDPNVFWHDETERWIMAVALPIDRRVLFYASENLIDWQPLSEFGPAGAQDGLWECPVLMELPIEGSDESRWVLKVDHNPGHIAGGSGAQYFIGDFDGTSFTADIPAVGEEPRWVDFGADFYCAMTFTNEPDAANGRTWIGWMSNWDYASTVPTHPWRGAMTLPRRVTLTERDGTLRLTQRPTAAFDQLHTDHRHYEGPSVEAIADQVAADPGGSVLDIDLNIAVGEAQRVGLDVAVGEHSAVRIRYDATGILTVDRSQSGEVGFGHGFASVHSAPLTPVDGTVSMRIVLDRSSIEVFADGGRVAVTDLIFPPSDADGIALVSEGGPSGEVTLDIRRLGSTADEANQ